MKILWFTNTPCSAAIKFGHDIHGGGWLTSLENKINTKIDLSIAYYDKNHTIPFDYNNTHYYPIQKYKNNIDYFTRTIFNRIEPKSDLNNFLRIIDSVNPDLIHIQGSENPFGLIINETKIPVVISIQGIPIVINHKYFQGIEKEYINKLYSMRHQITGRSFSRNIKKFSRKALREEKILKGCKNIIGRTEWDRRVTSVLSPSSKYFHNDEILRNVFYENKWENPMNNAIKLFSTNGNLLYKGIETIYQSAALLEKLNIDFVWEVAGIDKSSLIVTLLKKKIAIENLSKKVILLGKLNNEKLVNKLLGSNIFVMTSHIENSPNNLCEAMLLGMPIIATSVGGSPSLLHNNKEGILIQDGDPWVLTGAIMELNNNNNRAVEFGTNARKRALVRHDSKNIINGLLNIYESIIGQ